MNSAWFTFIFQFLGRQLDIAVIRAVNMVCGGRKREGELTASSVPLLEALWKNKLDILQKMEFCIYQKHGSATDCAS